MKHATFLSALLLVATAAFSQKTIPYGVDKKPLPAGEQFQKILPKKVGAFVLTEFKEPEPGLDGEALYKNGKEEIFMLFSRAKDAKDLKETMQTIHTETKGDALQELRDISLKTDSAYIHLIGKKIAFFAWTRGLYCFSADSNERNAATLKNFMDSFPY
jgi:hypothetical protein